MQVTNRETRAFTGHFGRGHDVMVAHFRGWWMETWVSEEA
jgi:hypothetical protein